MVKALRRPFFLMEPYQVPGYPKVCHGGIQAAILDEVMGLLLVENKIRRYRKAQAAGQTADVVDSVTAELTIKYLKPVVTPETYCVTVRLKERDGRKFSVEGVIEDSKGVALASGRGFFIEIRSQKI